MIHAVKQDRVIIRQPVANLDRPREIVDRGLVRVVRCCQTPRETPGLFLPELLEAMNVLLDETTEIPGGGGVATAYDVFRWAEALRRGGELEGARVLSPAILDLSTCNHTGTEPNHLFDYMRELRGWDEFPAFLGLGFFVRGEGIFPMPFGLTASPRTFGGLGAGSTMFLVDPERELVFVCLTVGLVEESRNFDRLQRLSDLVFSAITD